MIDTRRLLDRRRWAGPARWTNTLIAELTGDEATAIVRSSSIRRAIEEFLFQRCIEHPAVRGLLMFVRDDQDVVGFIEVVIDGPDACTWQILHGASTPSTAIPRDLDGLPRSQHRRSGGRTPDDCN